MTLYAFVGLCMNMYDYLWLCMPMYDYVWVCITMYAYLWLCMTMYDCLWLRMTMFDYLRQFKLFHLIKMFSQFSYFSTNLDFVYFRLPLFTFVEMAHLASMHSFVLVLISSRTYLLKFGSFLHQMIWEVKISLQIVYY